MVIKKLQINNFGKLKNKEIELNNGINVVYGENESGKSTLLKFITSMFYGASKNKNGNRISDFEKFMPWDEGEFSGKINYKLDNNEEYEIYRNFSKKNPQIIDKHGNDVSKNYTIDKTYGNRFFIEQTKVDEELFNMSMVVMQQEVKLDEKKQNTLIQKVSNIMSTGEDDVSYKKILGKLEKRQNDEIGTDKSPTKPLYITKQKIEELKREKKEIENIMPRQYEIDEEKNKIKKEITAGENELKLMQELQKIQNEEQIEEEKININKKSREDLEIKKSAEEEKLNEINNGKSKKKSHKKLYIISLLLTIITIIFVIIHKPTLYYIFLILAVLSFVAITTANLHENKRYKRANDVKNQEINNIKNKIEMIENEIKEKEKIITEKENDLYLKREINYQQIKNNFSNIESIDNLLKFNINSSNILNEQNFLNDLKLQINKLDVQKAEIKSKLENASKIQEELINLKENLEELVQYNDAINLAKESLKKAYIEMRQNVTPKFTKNLSNVISEISNGKYKNIKVNEVNELMIETENREICIIGCIKYWYNRPIIFIS